MVCFVRIALSSLWTEEKAEFTKKKHLYTQAYHFSKLRCNHCCWQRKDDPAQSRNFMAINTCGGPWESLSGQTYTLSIHFHLMLYTILNVTYLSKMSSSFHIARIAVIIMLFFAMEPPNSITAILFRVVHWQIQVPRIVFAVVILVVFCKIIGPVLRLFLKFLWPSDRRNLKRMKSEILLQCSLSNGKL